MPPGKPGWLIGHQDAAPCNAAMDGDRHAFRDVVAGRARRQARIIRDLAAGGDQAMVAILDRAQHLEIAADNVEKLPVDFWTAP